MRQRGDRDVALQILARGRAGKAVLAVHVHRAAAADALAARAAKGQRTVLLALHLDKRVEHHRPAFLQVDLEPVEMRIVAAVGAVAIDRSEEHTSELQSLMRISYAVFCLKKKNKKKD